MRILREKSNKNHSPIEVVQPGRVAETLRERVRVDLELRDELILVGRHRGEDRLRKHERLVVELLQLGRTRRHALVRPDAHQVDARLVAMHRVQHDLARLVHLVVRQLDLLERNHLPPERVRTDRGVRVRVEPGGWWRIRLPRHQPSRPMVRVPVAPIIQRNDVEQDGVPIGRRLVTHRTGKRDAHGREHALASNSLHSSLTCAISGERRSSSDTLAGVEAVRECVSRACSVLSSESLQSSTLTLISSSATSDERSGCVHPPSPELIADDRDEAYEARRAKRLPMTIKPRAGGSSKGKPFITRTRNEPLKQTLTLRYVCGSVFSPSVCILYGNDDDTRKRYDETTPR
uniref:Uncharacterized protein n=1 Tax=Anopheles farauti TaxID=69004 RepID=A0A182Q4U6_9DIPT